jgi:hypothetical protein
MSAPRRCGRDREIIKTPLPLRTVMRSVRAFDAAPARGTLMNSIMFDATAPAGCVPGLERFKR